MLFGSADHTSYAVGGDDCAEVVTSQQMELLEFADRPQSAWTPTDLSLVRRAAGPLQQRPEVRPFLDLVLGSLDCRFGGDAGAGQDGDGRQGG